jgi:hypothetical protein
MTLESNHQDLLELRRRRRRRTKSPQSLHVVCDGGGGCCLSTDNMSIILIVMFSRDFLARFVLQYFHEFFSFLLFHGMLQLLCFDEIFFVVFS